MNGMKYALMIIMIGSLYAFDVQKPENGETTDTRPSKKIVGETVPQNAVDQIDLTEILDKTLKLNLARIGNSEQIILVTNSSIVNTEVDVQAFEKTGNEWVEIFDLMEGLIGKNGFAPYKEKKEGDGKSPTGIFFLGPVFTYPEADVETKMEHWKASEQDYWIDDVNSALYNRWVTGNRDPNLDNISREEMKRPDDLYKYGVAVQYNMDQVKGMGSVIVFHVKGNSKKPTLGCVKIDEPQLIDIIGWLDPEKKPIIIMGTTEELVTRMVAENGLSENDKYVWKKEKWPPPAK